MGLEILAGRLVAPAFGHSVYTWGSVIGIFLAALSLGYALGARHAHQYASRRSLVVLLSTSTLAVAIVVLGGDAIISLFDTLAVPDRYGSILPVTVLFGPMTFLLGVISPFAAQLSTAKTHGGASGRVYAVGTIGSIVGAFGTTFLLIPTLSVPAIGLLLGVPLILAALSITDRSPAAIASIGFAIIVLAGASTVAVYGVPAGERVVVDTQTAYADLTVVDDGDVRTMYIGGVPQSAIYLDDREGYVFDYAKYAHLPLLVQNDTERVLFIGGGGFTLPQRFVELYPNVTVDAVEIDPEVVRVAREHFGLEESPRLTVYVEDGRSFLQQTNHTYDVIVLDAFRADRVPFHLTTTEFMELAASKLDEDGALIANTITVPAGDGSAFGRAVVKTMDRTFSQVYTFPTAPPRSLQNVELLAIKGDRDYSLDEFRAIATRKDLGVDLTGALDRYRRGEDVKTDDVPVLTDDYAPVDSLLANQLGKQYVISGWNGTARAGG